MFVSNFLKIKILIIKKGIAAAAYRDGWWDWGMGVGVAANERTQTNRPDFQIDICSFNPRQLKVMEALKIISFYFVASCFFIFCSSPMGILPKYTQHVNVSKHKHKYWQMGGRLRGGLGMKESERPFCDAKFFHLRIR